MKFDLRLAAARSLVALVGLVLAVSASPASLYAQSSSLSGWGPGGVELPFPTDVWPQTYSDLEPDPDIRFGTLENGMRYALRHNATPSNQASLRFWFDAGSMMEREDQLGLAHFLEHMAFNGSENVPEGEMIPTLERLGLAFGADTNASTGQARTTYQLDLPQTNDETVDTALMLFREVAGNLLIDPEAVDRERGVVLSEERSRDGPGYRLYKSELEFVLGDHIAVRRMPIGTPEILSSAPAQAIRDYYEAYYRPERAVLVAVGDFDVDDMEARIRETFSDWQGAGEAGADAPLTLPVQRDPDVRIEVEPGGSQSVSISWIAPPDLDPDTRDERLENLTEALAFAVLNRRLGRIAREPDAPFISAAAYSGDFFHSTEVTSLETTAVTGQWEPALDAVIEEQRRIAQYGVGADELAREIASVRTTLETIADRSATRQTPALAGEIVASLDNFNVVTSPAQDLERFNQIADQITVERVNAALTRAFAGAGPLVFLTSPQPIEGGEEVAIAALNDALTMAVEPGETLVAKTWPYVDFGEPGEVAEREDVLDLDTVFITYDNGVRLSIKPTRFRDEQILIQVRIGAGREGMPADEVPVDWSLPTSFIDGGLGELTAEEIEEIMTSRIVGASISVADDAFVMGGGTRPDDLDTQLQLLAAYVTDPGWRPEAFQRIRSLAATIHDQQDATVGGVMGRDLSELMRDGDERYAFPSRDEVQASSPDDLEALLETPLAEGPIEITVVGDVTVDDVIASVARTFGALPQRPGAEWAEPHSISPGFPAANAEPVVLTHKGRADQAAAVMAWPTEGFFADMHKARSLRVLGDILQIRLIEELRENQGATYSPQASFQASSVFEDYGFGAVTIETPPENIPGFFSTVETIVADLRDHLVDEDELQRAKAPAIEALAQNFENNGFWMGQLSGAQADRRRLDALRSARAGIERVTVEDVQAMAREYLIPGQDWRLVVLSEDADETPSLARNP